MSELGDISQAVRGLLAGLESGGAPVFRSVVPLFESDRRRVVARASELAMPAALVAYEGRVRADAAGVVGAPKLSVVMAVANLRGGADVGEGDGVSVGAFGVLGLAMQALDGVVVQSDRRLAAIDEQPVAADETRVVYEQRYVVDRVAEAVAPTFAGVALAGLVSVVQVVVGEVSAERAAFAFAGIDGEFEHHLGLRRRPIVWRGQLRAGTDGEMNEMEAAIEDAVAGAGAHELGDAWGRTFSDCVAETFERKGARRRHPVTGDVLQGFEVRFVQLNP